MKCYTLFLSLFCSFVGPLGLDAFAFSQAPLAGESSERLFVYSPSIQLEVAADRPEVVTANAIHLRTGLLVAAAQSESGRFEIQLPNGESHELVYKDSYHGLTGSWVWIADIVGSEFGYALFAVKGSSAVGVIDFIGEMYSVEPVRPEEGVHSLLSIDQMKQGVCGVDESHHVVSPVSSDLSLGASSGPMVADVLVAYLPAVSNNYGGQDGAVALAESAVAASNLAYASSEIPVELRLVAAQETLQGGDGDQGGMLSRLRSLSDGWYDEITALREQVGADFVALLVNSGSNCGVGYLMSNPSPSFDSYAFSVTKASCAVGNRTFAHELGHNMGCAHDRANAGASAYSFSYGYRTPGDAYRTVMAYAPGNRIGYFSNPDVIFAGFPLGVAAPASNSADNSQSIELTAPVFSEFRCGGPQAYGEPMATSQWEELQFAWSGTPEADGSGGFNLAIQNGVPGQFGILFYGENQSDAPFLGGNRYVGFPLIRMPVVQISAGGTAFFDWIGHAQPAPGQVNYLQFWQRDPGNPMGSNVAMSRGLRIDPCE